MKKIMFLLLLSMLLMSCDQDGLKYYQDSSLKTSEIERGKSSLRIQSLIEFGDEISEEDEDLVELMKSLEYRSDSVFDRAEDKKIVRQYFETDAFGLDTVFYNNQSVEFIKVPFAGKYMNLNDFIENEAIDFSVYEDIPFEEETMRLIEQLWFEVLSEEDVVNLGDAIINTAEGEVKVKKFAISFSHDQLKTFVERVLNYVELDMKFRETFKTYPAFVIEDNKLDVLENEQLLSLDQALIEFNKQLDEIVVNEFKMLAYIDIDQYVIHSEYDVHLSFVGEMGKYIDSIRLNAEYQLYDLHEKNTFEFPVLTHENTTDIETIIEDFDLELYND